MLHWFRMHNTLRLHILHVCSDYPEVNVIQIQGGVSRALFASLNFNRYT